MSPSEPRVSRVKRKPAPSLHWSEKYPPPDPTDPFAPLWALRNRSSTLLASQEDVRSVISQATSFTLYPDAPTAVVDVPAPIRSPAPKRVTAQSHYRRRSQSVAHFQPLPPELSTGAATADGPPPRIARLLPKKKDSFASLNSVVSASKLTKRSRKISTSSISSPAPFPINAELPPKLRSEAGFTIQTLATLDSTLYPPRRPMKTFDLKPAPELDPTLNGFCSEPETLSFSSVPSTLRRSSVMVSTPTSSTQSHSSSSYINVSRQSLCHPGDDNSLLKPSHTAHSLYRFPFRRATRPTHEHSSSLSSTSTACSYTRPEWELPTESQLLHVSTLPVISQSGIRVPFGSLFANQRTIVIFIRHFWCPLCQDYMSSLTSLVDPSQLVIRDTKQPIDLVVIGNGSHALIPKYKQIFGLKCEMYVDPQLRLYEALGMGMINDACTLRSEQKDKGYVKRSSIGGLTMVVLRALRVKMPVWERGGDVRQLGGEFVLGPGLRCVYGHRMQNPKGHAPILEVLDAARKAFPPASSTPTSRHKRSAKVRSRSVFDIPSASDFERSPKKHGIPKLIRTSATWDGGLTTNIPSDEFTKKRQSVCGALTTDEQQPIHRKLTNNRNVRKSLSLTVSVSVPSKGNADDDNDLVVLFEDRRGERDDIVHAYASP